MRVVNTLKFKRDGAPDVECPVKELTVEEVREWLAAPERLDASLFDLHLVALVSGRKMMPADLYRLTDLTAERLGDFYPSELRQIVAGIEEMNRDFFALQESLVAAAPMLSALLSEAPAASPGSGTAELSGATPGAPS